MPDLATQGATLHYQVAGEGPPLVLVHGASTDHSTWDCVVDDLASDHRVITYDRRGYGRSHHRPVRDSRIHARDLAVLLKQVAQQPAKVVGWSAGGNITLVAAVDNPELFSAVCVVEPPFHGLRYANMPALRTALRLKIGQVLGRRVVGLEAFYRFATSLRSGGNGYDAAGDELREYLLKNSGPVFAEWGNPYSTFAEYLPARAVVDLPVPLTWLIGAESFPWFANLRNHVARRRPDLRLVDIPDAGHLTHVENPDGFAKAVRAAPTLP
ncbi:alpha/beta hydrolase [Mycobacterium sp. Aquia_216]|uniref:alpha/beta fold hydrolase n=1 Tax=Mycobacterium sp. Aquia_216 TaxID=2991729 RepID=UPI00227AA226|nr:alpha/beta hydrolase [Mycobacterium sp. Aquia_216]WAJ46617.1 alpha/beta hydrolase [Mycobacterium sp. Aquia_216]